MADKISFGPMAPPAAPLSDGKAAVGLDKAQAVRLASELYRAMKGGPWGTGTDEHRVFEALEGLAPEQAQAVRDAYQHHYGRDLEHDLQRELTRLDEQRALLAVTGDAAGSDAVALHQATRKLKPNVNQVLDVLQSASAGDRVGGVREAFAQRYGDTLDERLEHKLKPSMQAVSQALLAGDPESRQAVALWRTLGVRHFDGAGLDRLFASLRNGGPGLAAAFERVFGGSIESALQDKLATDELDAARALLSGDAAGYRAAIVHRALRRDGADDWARIVGALNGLEPGARQEVGVVFQRLYGSDIAAATRAAGTTLAADTVGRILADGELPAVDRLNLALVGQDQASALELLGTLSGEQVRALDATYLERFGRPLHEAIRRAFRGEERFELFQAEQGKPESTEEAVARIRERRDFHRRGLANAVSRVLLDDVLLTRKGRLLDRDLDKLEQLLDDAQHDGLINGGEREELARLALEVQEDLTTYGEVKQKVAQKASGLGTVAATMAVAATGGAATPFVVGALAATAAGAAGRVAGHAAIAGRSYTAADAQADVIRGGALGLGYAVGGELSELVVEELARKVGELTLIQTGVSAADRTDLAINVAGEWMADGPPGVAFSALGRGVEFGTAMASAEVATSASQRETWQDGPLKGISCLLGRAAAGATDGFVAGAAAGVIVALAGAAPRIRLLTAEQQASNVKDMIIQTPSGPQTVQLVGPATPELREAVRDGLQEICDKTGGVATQKLQSVYVFPLGEHAIGKAYLGADNFALDTSLNKWTSLADNVSHHELAHNLDTFGMSGQLNRLVHTISTAPDSPFGKGEFLTDYAKTNRFEDFAETHEDLIANWDEILANADSLEEMGSIGLKYKYILENLYPEQYEKALAVS